LDRLAPSESVQSLDANVEVGRRRINGEDVDRVGYALRVGVGQLPAGSACGRVPASHSRRSSDVGEVLQRAKRGVALGQ